MFILYEMEEEDRTGSEYTGILMIVVGALLAAFAYMRYLKVQREIDARTYAPANSLSAILTAVIMLASLTLVFYLLKTF